MVDKEGGMRMDDAAGFFANVFGGERFKDYVRSHLTSCYACLPMIPLEIQIGEISLMKEMTSVATTMMTEEEKTEMEKELNGGRTPGTSSPPQATIPSSPAAEVPHTDTPRPAYQPRQRRVSYLTDSFSGREHREQERRHRSPLTQREGEGREA